MTTFNFSLEDLARTRFAISPMWECITGLRAIRDPARAAVHLPWVKEALPIAHGLDLGGALALTPAEGYIPDFLTPPPSTPLASFDEELELLRSTPPELVTAEVRTLIESGVEPTATVTAFIERPREEVERMTAAIGEFWKLALEPHWPRIRALLEDDVRYRARQLTEGGPAKLFGDIHPSVSWSGDQIEISSFACHFDGNLAGRGLLLVPSALQVTRPASIVDAPWQPTLFYPARGTALLWEPEPEVGPEALVRLVGGTRARLLASLSSPRSTTDLAGSLGLSAGGVSEHLSVLRDSGLICGEREGRSVLYLRTRLAEDLLGLTGAPADAFDGAGAR